MESKEPLSQGVINIVRSFVRPALTFFGLVSWVMLFMNGYQIPDAFTWLVFGMILFWFGDRSFFKLNEIMKGGKK